MTRIVVIGGGHAGGQLLDAVRRAGHTGELVLVSDEPLPPYHRPPLSKKYLAGELAPERLCFRPPPVMEKLDVDFQLGTAVTVIDRDGRRVGLADGRWLDYDRLALATGARARILPGSEDLAGVHTLRSLADADALRAAVSTPRRLVVIGAGFIGLEAAATLRTLGHEVVVIEQQHALMPRAVNGEAAHYLAARHREAGVTLALGRTVTALEGRNRVEAVATDDGTRYPADLVLIGIGVLPNTALAEAAGLDCEDGIRVDELCRSSDPDIVAAGDCTRHPNALLGRELRLESVHNATEQARTAAATLVGQSRPYRQVPWFWTDQYDCKLQMVGLSDPADDRVLLGDRAEHRFSVAHFRDHRLVAVDSLNQPAEHMAARKLLAMDQPFSRTDLNAEGLAGLARQASSGV